MDNNSVHSDIAQELKNIEAKISSLQQAALDLNNALGSLPAFPDHHDIIDHQEHVFFQ